MATIDARTGLIISGLAEVIQSINTILTTPKRTRLMRRDFGAEMPKFVDRGINELNLIDYYAEIAAAIRSEPRFKLDKLQLSQDSNITNGHALFDIQGTYYPRGHLGDYSEAVTAGGSVAYADPG